MWRAAQMNWVNIMLHRRFVPRVMGLLAASQSFEIQPMNEGKGCGVPEQYKTRLQNLQAKLRAYQAYLPELKAGDQQYLPTNSLERALPTIELAVENWIDHIHFPGTKIKALNTKLYESRFLIQCLRFIPDNSLLLDTFNTAAQYKPFIGVGNSENLAPLQDDGRLLMEMYPLPADKHKAAPDTVFVGLFPVADASELERNLRASGVRFAKIPAMLAGSPGQALISLESDLLVVEKHVNALQGEIEWHSEKDQISLWARQLQRWLWLVEVMHSAACDVRFVQICGWVPHNKLDNLETALQDSDGPYLLQTDPPVEHGEPPILLDNHKWLKPFENFVRGFGVPRSNEIDPTPMLGLVTPLMFGYMFGDVGQGLVLALLGYLLRERMPILALFIPAGVSAMIFGLLYGSVFSYEELIPPLWLHPMHEPLKVMGLALVFGAFMLISSLVLSAIQSYWDGHMESWVAEKLPLLVLAFALPIFFVDVTFGAVLAIFAVLITLFTAWFKSGRKGALLNSLKLLEDGIQLAMNMLSFIRLGAFTLAHGGLSAAVMVLTMMPDNTLARLFIFVTGNALVIALEGLVVSIQTTRLVMFEFFRRFLDGTGRPFRPLTDPAIS